MTRAEQDAMKMGLTMKEIYEIIKNNPAMKNSCNEMLSDGMDFDEACVLAYRFGGKSTRK